MNYFQQSITQRVLTLTFEDSTSRNSLSLRAAEELVERLTRLRADFDGLIFRAKGRVFCSGGHLGDYAAMNAASEGITVNSRITDILGQLASLKQPTVAVIEGDCFGGGIELLSAFDHVIVAPHLMFGLWQRQIGLTFGWGGAARLEQRLGVGVLKRLALSTENITSAQALEFGLIDEIALQSQLMVRAEAWAQRMLQLPQAPIASLKAWSSDREAEIFEKLWWNPEHRGQLATRLKK